LRLSAVGKSPISSEWEVIRKLSVAIFDQAIERGTLTPPQFIQLGLTWKRRTNSHGWGGIASQLDPKSRASLAYVMAHRDLHLAMAIEAAEFLKAGGATAGEG